MERFSFLRFSVDAVTRQTEAFVKALATVLRLAREDKGISKIELATRAGLSQPYIGYIEQGARCPTAESLKRLALALEIPLHQLIRRTEELSER